MFQMFLFHCGLSFWVETCVCAFKDGFLEATVCAPALFKGSECSKRYMWTYLAWESKDRETQVRLHLKGKVVSSVFECHWDLRWPHLIVGFHMTAQVSAQGGQKVVERQNAYIWTSRQGCPSQLWPSPFVLWIIMERILCICIIHANMKNKTTNIFTLVHVFDQQPRENNAISYSRIHTRNGDLLLNIGM